MKRLLLFALLAMSLQVNAGRIGNYPSKASPLADNDKLMGTDSVSGGTKNFKLSTVKDYVENPTAIILTNDAYTGGDTSVTTQRGIDTVDVQGKRDAADLSDLYWSGSITAFEDAGGGSVKAYYGDGGIELQNGDSVTISDSTVASYDGVYTISGVITDIEDSFIFVPVGGYVSTATATWTNQRLYDNLRFDLNQNDNSWALDNLTEFFAESADSLTIGDRVRSHYGWGGEWSNNTQGGGFGYQIMTGGKNSYGFGANIAIDGPFSQAIGDNIHFSEWATRGLGNHLRGQGGDGLLLGSHLNTYGWRLTNVGHGNHVEGNESIIVAVDSTIHDAYGIDLNETPDALHNRFNVNIGEKNIIGTTSDLGDRSNGSITAFADAGTVVPHTIVTSIAHGLSTGDAVEITVTTNYNDKYSVEVLTVDTFRINAVFIVDDATGTWSQNYTINNAITVGSNHLVEVDGAVSIGKGLINTEYENAIEMGASNNNKIEVREDGRFMFPGYAAAGTPPTSTPGDAEYLRLNSFTFYTDGSKTWMYVNIAGVINRAQIGVGFTPIP